MAAQTAHLTGEASDLLGQAFPLDRDPIILFTLSQPGIALDGTFVGTFERRLQISSVGHFEGDLIPSTTIRADGNAVFYKIKLGVRDSAAQYRLIDLPQFRLYLPPAGGLFRDLVVAPPPAQVIANGYGPPPEWMTNNFYVDVSGDDPELFGPPNGVI